MIEIRNFTKTKINKKLLVKLLDVERLTLTKKKLSFPGLSVVFVGPKQAQAFNKKYRKKTYIPNVLSFDYGEIVLCPAKIRHDAKKYGILFEQELVRVFTHGLLHVGGYSHKEIANKFKDFA